MVIPEPVSFALTPTVRSGAVFRGGARRMRREFLDFVIDGRPLLPLFDEADLVSVLTTDRPAAESGADVDRLLLRAPSDLPGGRQVLYCCPECEDIGCGAVTAVIVRHDKHVIWREFGWQDWAEEIEELPHLGPFRFSEYEYRRVLQQVRTGNKEMG